MPFYEIDFEYKITEFGTVTMEADDVEQAEDMAREYVAEAYPDVHDVTIEEIKEIKR